MMRTGKDLQCFIILCQYGQSEIVKLLLERNRSSVNRASDIGETPLMIAARTSNLMIVKQLLEAGATARLFECKGRYGVAFGSYIRECSFGKSAA